MDSKHLNEINKISMLKILVKSVFLFSAVLIIIPHAFAFDGPGLYKNGQKIMGFSFNSTEDTDAPKSLSANNAETVGQVGIRAQSTLRDTGQPADFARIAFSCKELANEIKLKLEQGADVETDITRIVQLKNELIIANKEILENFENVKRECLEKKYDQTILDRHEKAVRAHEAGVENLLSALDELLNNSVSDRLDEKVEALNRYFSDKKYKNDPQFINSQALPVNIMNVEAPVAAKQNDYDQTVATAQPKLIAEGSTVKTKIIKPPTEKMAAAFIVRPTDPAALTISSASVPTQDDLDPTIDVQITQEIIDLAASLDNSPLKIYEYVKNNFKFEPYLGSRKGASETLNHKSGNDYDLASVLIALLRASGIPAKYATGIVEMPVDMVQNWLAVEDSATAGSILTTAGMEGVNIISGEEVVSIQCRRVWVEAYIPYTNYRGINADTTGQMWIPMDPAMKQYDYRAGIDIPAEMGFDAKGFIDDYIATFHEDSPVDLFKQEITSYLSINYPDLSYEDILRARTPQTERLGIIPGSLPYTVLSRDDAYAEIPSDKRYQIRFYIHGEGAMLDYTANLPEIAGKQVTISYIGETASDQQLIDDAGGIYGIASPWLVSLKPVLKIDGCVVATGSGGVIMGMSQSSDMFFTPPDGASNQVPAIYNTIIAGGYQGIGINTWNVVQDLLSPATTTCEESYTGYLLHDTAMKYLGRVNAADNQVAGAMHMVVINDVAEAIVEHVVNVSYNGYGTPVSFEWHGLRVDADRKIVGTFSVTGEDESKAFMRLAGADGSLLENLIFEDEYGEEAISTIKILELASDMGIPIYTFDSSNADTIYSRLNLSSSTENAIYTAVVSNGHEVTVPRDNITYYEWTGTGYIDMDPDTCAAGYIISGGTSGGQTVKEWEIDLSGVYCINAAISQPSADAPALAALFNSRDTDYLIFKADISKYDEDCQFISTEKKEFSTSKGSGSPLTIKQIADEYGGGIYTFNAGTTGYSSCASCGYDTRKFYIVKADLQLWDNASEDDEETQGAYIAVNDDNDDEAGGNKIPDREQTTQVSGENDLKELKINLDAPDFYNDDPAGITKVTLKRDNNNIRIWKQNDKSDGGILVNSNEKTWDLTNASDRNDFQSLLAGGDDYIVYVEGYNPGVTNITLEYKKANGSFVEKDVVKVTAIKINFKIYEKNIAGPDKPHALNLETRQGEKAHYAPYSKCVSHVGSTDALDLAQYLEGYDDADNRTIFHTVLKWQVNGTWQESYKLNLGAEPDSDEIKRFNIGVALDKEGEIRDYLIITMVPQATQTAFNQWHANEVKPANMKWLEEQPALYTKLTFNFFGVKNPEPGDCDFWKKPGKKSTYYHPDGSYEMRSEMTAGGHGHQAIYKSKKEGGGIITSGVSAGSADREAPFSIPEQLNPLLHVNADVKPFVWAAQLDGNPVEENGTTMTNPMLHEGAYLKQYFQVRPARANTKKDLDPGKCPATE